MQPNWSKPRYFRLVACGDQLGTRISTDTELKWLEYVKAQNWEPRAGTDRESDTFAEKIVIHVRMTSPITTAIHKVLKTWNE